MTNILNFKGFIKNVSYQAFLTEELKKIALESFDINKANSYGIIKSSNAEVAFSKWVSPKRTRSYPFARIYNTYNSSKIITIIPVIKDEGKDGDRDRIQYSTISWMNLLNIYIVLAYYEEAEKSEKKGQSSKQKITHQKFNNSFVKSQIQEILNYRQSALHWNKNLFEDNFTNIFSKALDCYDSISEKTGIQIHARKSMDIYLQQITNEFEEFKKISLKNSENASMREAMTSHYLENLVDGDKATFNITNYLGGIYYLNPDEIIKKDDIYVIQESKNASQQSLPKLPDIQDGLFKLILFSNLDTLSLNERKVKFITRLKLTGKNIINSIILPCSSEKLECFIDSNNQIFNNKQIKIIKKLDLEAQKNCKISIEITAN